VLEWVGPGESGGSAGDGERGRGRAHDVDGDA